MKAKAAAPASEVWLLGIPGHGAEPGIPDGQGSTSLVCLLSLARTGACRGHGEVPAQPGGRGQAGTGLSSSTVDGTSG